MISVRNFLALFAILTLAAFALPAAAGTKQVCLDNDPTHAAVLGATLPAGQQKTIYLRVINCGTAGNGSSFEIDFTATPGFVVTGGYIVEKPSVTGTPVTPGQTPPVPTFNGIQFTYTLPTKTYATVALTVNVSPSCATAAQQLTWNVYMWSGGVGTPSNSFGQAALGTYTSSFPTATTCILQITQQPASAFVNPAIITSAPFNSGGTPVTVNLIGDGNPIAGATVSLKLASTSAACAIAQVNAVTDASGNAKFTTLTSTATATVPVPGGCVLTASSSGFTSQNSYSNTTDGTFSVVVPDGTLGCSSTNNTAAGSTYDPDAAGDFYGTPGFGLKRHTNLTGDCPSPIPYTFSFDPGTNQAYFVADKLGQAVIVEYVLVLNPENTVSGWPSPESIHPSFASAPYVNYPPLASDYIAGVACNNDLVDNTSMPAGVKACVAQLGWTGVAVGKIQRWFKAIDTDSYVKW